MFILSPNSSSNEVLRKLFLILAFGSIVITTGCGRSMTETNDTTHTIREIADSNFEDTDLSEQTHGNSTDPAFDDFFDDTQIRHHDLVIPQKRWMI